MNSRERIKKTFRMSLLLISIIALEKTIRADETNFSDVCRLVNFQSGKTNSFYFVQVTDTHLRVDKPERTAQFERFMSEITALTPKPAFVFMTGDNTEGKCDGQTNNIKILKRLLGKYKDVPIYFCLGGRGHEHSLPYSKIFPDYHRFGNFSHGGVQFAWLDLYPDPHADYGAVTTLNSGFLKIDPPSLGSEQTAWLKELANSDAGTLVIFSHIRPIKASHSADEYSFDLMHALSNVKREIWNICGHNHSNTWKRFKFYEQELYYVTTQDLNQNTYCLFFVREGKIDRVAYKKLDGAFSILPPPQQWETDWMFFGPQYSLLLLVNIPKDEDYLVKNRDSIKSISSRLIRDEGELIYRVPLPPGAKYLGLYCAGQYALDVSSNGKDDWKAISNRTKFNADWHDIFTLPSDVLHGKEIFIRFRDPVPGDKWGVAPMWFALLGEK